MQAPSEGNQQPWEFYVVTDKKKLTALSQVHPYAGMTKNAPAAIVAVYRTDCRMPEYAQIDLAIAMENLWLETDAQGLGGVWLGIAPKEERMKAVEEQPQKRTTLQSISPAHFRNWLHCVTRNRLWNCTKNSDLEETDDRLKTCTMLLAPL